MEMATTLLSNDYIMSTEADEVREILSKFGLKPEEYNPVVQALRNRPEDWVEFMMR